MTRAQWQRHLPSLSFLGVALTIVGTIGAGLIYVGAYDIAADVPHTPIVYSLLETLRNRSIAVRARDIIPPFDLGSRQRIATGAALYQEMCSSCHLGPGVERSEISQGLYPQAPELAEAQALSPARQFWIIKHGVKLSAMPAWGRTHPDPLIWDMVSFVQKLPGMSPAEYHRLVSEAPSDHDAIMTGMGN